MHSNTKSSNRPSNLIHVNDQAVASGRGANGAKNSGGGAGREATTSGESAINKKADW